MGLGLDQQFQWNFLSLKWLNAERMSLFLRLLSRWSYKILPYLLTRCPSDRVPKGCCASMLFLACGSWGLEGTSYRRLSWLNWIPKLMCASYIYTWSHFDHFGIAYVLITHAKPLSTKALEHRSSWGSVSATNERWRNPLIQL